MKCPECGKNSNVTISNKVYCTNCGAVISDSTASANAAQPADTSPKTDSAEPAQSTPPAAGPAAKMTDIAVPSAKAGAAALPVSPADRPVVNPITATRTMQDVMRPAAAYHNPAPVATPATDELKPITEHTTTPVPSVPVQAPSAVTGPPSERLAAAQSVPKSESIVKFHEPLPQPASADAVAVEIKPIAEPAEAKPTSPAPVEIKPAAPVKVTPPEITTPEAPSAPIVAAPAPAPLPEPAVPAPAAPVSVPAPTPETQLPAPAVTQHEAMQNLVSQPAVASKDDAFRLAMEAAATPARPNPAAVGAAALAVVVMGGYIWLQNYPRMQLSAVAGRAGFSASLPGYLPSSYKLDGPVKATTGQVSLHYSATGLPGITVTQKVTSWDSSSLADNYVAAQDPTFSSVQGNGLTVYLFGNGQASWVNHGVWYNITGASRLSRDELLKLAYSL